MKIFQWILTFLHDYLESLIKFMAFFPAAAMLPVTMDTDSVHIAFWELSPTPAFEVCICKHSHLENHL